MDWWARSLPLNWEKKDCNIVEAGALGSAPAANASPDWLGSHVQHLRTKVHIDDPRSVVLVRFYREAGANAN